LPLLSDSPTYFRKLIFTLSNKDAQDPIFVLLNGVYWEPFP
jgi:hypothetical protein